MKKTTMILKSPDTEEFYTIVETDYGFAIYADPEQFNCVLTIGDNGKGMLLATKNGPYTYLDLVKPVREVYSETYKEIRKSSLNNTMLHHKTEFNHRIYIIPAQENDDESTSLARVFYIEKDGTAYELLHLNMSVKEYNTQLNLTCKGIMSKPF